MLGGIIAETKATTDLLKRKPPNSDAKFMKCDCLTEINAKLKEQGLKLSDRHLKLCVSKDLRTMRARLCLDTQTSDGKRRKCPPVFVSFCPFCGEKSA